MSMIDSTWEVWDGQALTSAEYSHSNGSLIDLEENGVTDESLPCNLFLNIAVGTAFAGLASGVMIEVVTSDSATFATGNVPIMGIGGTTNPMSAAMLAAGKKFSISCTVFDLKKYLGIYWEPVSEAASAGTLDAWFGLEPIQTLKTQKFPDGYS